MAIGPRNDYIDPRPVVTEVKIIWSQQHRAVHFSAQETTIAVLVLVGLGLQEDTQLKTDATAKLSM